jgi:hypothetical protein
MTRRSLHSAVLEVGLYYEKRWSVDEIARFTFRLKRRRLRAEKRAARARRAARPIPLRVAYQIGPAGGRPAAQVPVMTQADARKANQRLLERVRAQLSRRLMRAADRERIDLPCLVCGRPATGWTYLSRHHNNVLATDAYATCGAHRSEESVKQLAGTGAR